LKLSNFNQNHFGKNAVFSKIHATLWRTALAGSESMCKSKMLQGNTELSGRCPEPHRGKRQPYAGEAGDSASLSFYGLAFLVFERRFCPGTPPPGGNIPGAASHWQTCSPAVLPTARDRVCGRNRIGRLRLYFYVKQN
jgi:hypothetical protein